MLGYLIGVPMQALINFVLKLTGQRRMSDLAPEWDAPSPRVRGEGGREERRAPAELVLDLDGYEGPIDLLLALAREQKVDLAQISILALADQYLAFIAGSRQLRLEIAADYLVMAAWLAYLKSRLLLPQPPQEDEPERRRAGRGAGASAALLEAMQTRRPAADGAAAARPRRFCAAPPEGLATVGGAGFELSLYELLRAYGDGRRRSTAAVLTIEPSVFHSIDDALKRLARFLGQVPDWRELTRFLPDELRGGELRRSALAATFAAALELARDGQGRAAPGPRLRADLSAQPALGGAAQRRRGDRR